MIIIKKIIDRYLDYIYWILSFILSLLILFFPSIIKYDQYLFFSAIIITFYAAFTIVYLTIKIKMKLFTVLCFFLIFLLMFNYGNLFVNFINSDYDYSVFDFLHYYHDESNIKAIQYSYITINFIILGLCLFHKNNINLIKKINNSKFLGIKNKLNVNKKYLRIYSILIILISLPIELYINLNKLYIGFTQGYIATYDFNISGILIQISKFYIIGFILLAISYFNESKRKSYFLFLLLLFYQILIMMSGNRGYQVITICILAIIFFSEYATLDKKKFLLLIFLSILLLFFVTGISKIRNEGYTSIDDFLNSLIQIKNNPLISVFDEFGFTLYTLSLTIDQVPAITPYAHGLTFIGSFSSVFPNISESINNAINFSNFVIHLNGGSIGGSIIAELFYNFSYFGCFFGIFIGYIVSFLSLSLSKALESRNYFFLSFLILPSISLLWWIRDSFLNIPRMLVYSIVFLLLSYFLTIILSNRKWKK